MTRYEVVLQPDAETEIREAFLWYHERSPLAAHDFMSKVFDAVDVLAADASMWPEDEDGVRYYVLRHFPFTIRYEIDGLAVTVLAVAHQRRRPGYWKER